MTMVRFTENLHRHVACPPREAAGGTVRAVLDDALSDDGKLRAYILDDRGLLRKHVTIFVNNRMIADRAGLSDPVGPRDEVFVFQALSGG